MKIWSDEKAMATLPTVVAASFALVVFVLLANLVLVQYAHGAARTAVDEAVRRAAVAPDPSAVCLAAVDEALDDLLGGEFGAHLHSSCRPTEGGVEAAIRGTLPALLPLLPDFPIGVEAHALRVGGDG